MIKQIENAKIHNVELNKAKVEVKPIKKIQLTEYHSKLYLSKIAEAQSEKVLFILPNGKEYINESKRDTKL